MRRNSITHAHSLVGALMFLLTIFLPAMAFGDETYAEEDVLAAATGFFGETSEGLASVIQKVFDDLGEPNAFIAGEEVSGAIGIGVRYGRGELNRSNGETRNVFWQGPSIGFDFGGNASKVFVLVYSLGETEQLFKRYPAVDGSIYFIAGVGANYHQSGNVVLAPIRTGVGLRAGINIGYMHYTRKHSWLPL